MGESVVDGDGIGEATATAAFGLVFAFGRRAFPKRELNVLPLGSVDPDESETILSPNANDPPGGIGPAASDPRSDEV